MLLTHDKPKPRGRGKPEIPVYDGVAHTPATIFQAQLLDNQEGANTERYVSESSRRDLWHRHRSNCGHTHHGKSAQGGVTHNIHRRKRQVRKQGSV